MMRFMQMILCGLLSVYSGAVFAQIEKIFDRNGCGCVLDKKKLSDERYITAVKVHFSPTKIKASFEINGTTNQQAVNFINLLANNLTNLEKNAWLQKLKGVDNELKRTLTNANLNAWNEAANAATREVRKGKPVIGWLIYTTCQLAETLHNFYLKNPQKAPAEHRNFYQNPSNSNNQNANTSQNTNSTHTNNLTIPEQIKQVKMIYVIGIAAAFSLLTLLLAWLLLRGAKTPDSIDPTQTVLKSEQFKTTMQSFAASMERQINAAFQQINDNIEAKFTSFSTGDNSDKLSEIEAKIDKIPVVNVQLIESFLTDIDKRMRQLETLPRSKDGFVIQSSELLAWIQENKNLQNALKESLDIELLRDTIIKLQPQAWGGKELSEIEKETIARMWKIYELKEEFLPKFKQQLIAEVETAVNRVLNQRR